MNRRIVVKKNNIPPDYGGIFPFYIPIFALRLIALMPIFEVPWGI